MPCKDHVWKIGPYVDGELPVGERDQVESHLQECLDCRDLASEFSTLDSLAGRDEVPAVSGEEWSKMLADVTFESRRFDRRGAPRRTWEWLVPVASVAALLLVAVFVGPSLTDSTGGSRDHEAKSEGQAQPVVIDGDEDELDGADRARRGGGSPPGAQEVLER